MDKLKNNLASVAALIGVLGAIGTGFVKYGEVMTRLESMESTDLKPIQKQISSSDTKIAVLETKIEKLLQSSDGQLKTDVKVLQTEIKLFKLEIREIKESNKNPLQG